MRRNYNQIFLHTQSFVFLNFQETRDFIFLQIFRRNTLTFVAHCPNK
nr:MAG TPA: hypothetical protein [Caudoviricetes sp.]